MDNLSIFQISIGKKFTDGKGCHRRRYRGTALFFLNEPYYYTTINNTIDYFSPANENDFLIAETASSNA